MSEPTTPYPPHLPLLTQALLDSQECEHSEECPEEEHDHNELWLMQRCHHAVGLDAVYHKQYGCLTLCCNVCGGVTAVVKVAAT